MFDGNWSLRDVIGDGLYLLLIMLLALSWVFGFFTASLFNKQAREEYRQEAIERGFASYKVDNKGNVSFEWNK